MLHSEDLLVVLNQPAANEVEAEAALKVFTTKPANNKHGWQGLKYDLFDIDTPEKYIVAEHGEQFWPKFRVLAKKLMLPQPDRSALDYGFASLARIPRDFEKSAGAQNPTNRELVAKDLGLIVASRFEVGFDRKLLPSRNTGMLQRKNDRAIQVGSFIDFAHHTANDRFSLLPVGFGIQETRLVAAFALLLESQLAVVHQEI